MTVNTVELKSKELLTLPKSVTVSRGPQSIDQLLEPIDQLLEEGRFDICYRLLKYLDALLGRHEKLEKRIDKLYRSWIPRWHFSMLNDKSRNQAFADAFSRIDLKDKTVLDIGAGSSLLSMMAIKEGARHAYACEMVIPVAEKAMEIVRINGYKNHITIIQKRSFDIVIGEDMPGLTDVFVSETIDCGFIGEGFLSLLQHAKQKLLKPNAILIPRSFSLKGQLLESTNIAELNKVHQSHGFYMEDFNSFSTQGYFPIRLNQWPHRPLTEKNTLIDVDLSSYDFEPIEQKIEFEITYSGKIHGLVFWFYTELVPGVFISNAPENEYSHWNQAFFEFDSMMPVEKGDKITINFILCKDEIDMKIVKIIKHKRLT